MDESSGGVVRRVNCLGESCSDRFKFSCNLNSIAKNAIRALSCLSF